MSCWFSSFFGPISRDSHHALNIWRPHPDCPACCWRISATEAVKMIRNCKPSRLCAKEWFVAPLWICSCPLLAHYILYMLQYVTMRGKVPGETWWFCHLATEFAHDIIGKGRLERESAGSAKHAKLSQFGRSLRSPIDVEVGPFDNMLILALETYQDRRNTRNMR